MPKRNQKTLKSHGILFYIPSMGVGGAQLLLLDLARGLRDSGLDVTVASNYLNLADRGFEVMLLPSPEDVAAALDRLDPAVVFFSNSPVPLIAREYSKASSKFIEVVQSNKKLDPEASYYTSEFTDHLVFVSPSTRQYYFEEIPDSKCTIIPNGIDFTKFIPAPDRHTSTSRLRILSIGRVDFGVKSTLDLIEVVRKLSDSDCSFVHLGGGPALGQLTRDLADQISTHRFESIPWTNDVLTQYQEADVFISLSRNEGFGLAIAEAASCELPVVMRPCHGISNFFVHGVNCFIAKDIDEFVCNLRVLKNEPHLRSSMGQRSRELIRSRFGRDRMIQDYIRLLHQNCASKLQIF